VLNPDFENFKFSTWPEFRLWIPWQYVIERDLYMGEQGWEPRQPFTLHFTTGATVYCKGIKEPDSARGPNISWLWLDEGARDKTGLSWRIAIAGVRIPPSPAAWITTTPRGIRHWLAREFVDKRIPAEVQELLADIGHEGPLYEYFHASIHDNKHNLDPMFYASMLTSYVGWMREQEIEGQFVEAGGTLAERHWFEIVDYAPAGARQVRAWDFAATEKKRKGDDPDWTAGLRLAKMEGIYYVEHITRARARAGDVRRLVRQTAEVDGRRAHIGLEQEPGAAGKSVIADYVQALDGFVVRGYRPSGDKVARAMPWLAQAQAGNVKLVRGEWNEAFLDEVEAFPEGPHDDMVDAMSLAYQMLVRVQDSGGSLAEAQARLTAPSRWGTGGGQPRWRRSRR
jgi:predicted phage terminase large subunit-like protein